MTVGAITVTHWYYWERMMKSETQTEKTPRELASAIRTMGRRKDALYVLRRAARGRASGFGKDFRNSAEIDRLVAQALTIVKSRAHRGVVQKDCNRCDWTAASIESLARKAHYKCAMAEFGAMVKIAKGKASYFDYPYPPSARGVLAHFDAMKRTVPMNIRAFLSRYDCPANQ